MAFIKSDGLAGKASRAQTPNPLGGTLSIPGLGGVPFGGIDGLTLADSFLNLTRRRDGLPQGLAPAMPIAPPAQPPAPTSYMPTPVSANQRIPMGLGSNVFRSTLAPLQQQNYGLGQIDPRLLTGIFQLPGGRA